MFENYMQSINRSSPAENTQDKYKKKITRLKQQIREYVHVRIESVGFFEQHKQIIALGECSAFG